MTDIKTEFAKNLYVEIESDEDGRALVRNTVSQQVFVKKTLEVFSIPVFAFLKKHHHPHVCSVEDYWEEDGKLVVIEELISGKTLEYLLDNDALSFETKKDLLLQILDGVSFLHQANPKIIHRDLKASNIMVTADNVVKIIDYDAAKIYQPNETKDTVLMGTEGSAAPEQYGFMPSDERTDIYALGILMKQMFPQDLRMLEIGKKASSFAPEKRYSSVQELKAEITKGFHLQDIWLNIPGIRSKNVLMRVIAVFLYAAIIVSAFQSRPQNGVKDALSSLVLIGICFSWIDLFGHWTGLFERAPWIHHTNRFLRILGYFFASIGIFLFWAMVLGIVQSLLK